MMNNAYYHAEKWREALQAKAQTKIGSTDNQLADIFIGYERMRAWMCVAHEAMKLSSPFESIVKCSKEFVGDKSANKLAIALIALVSIEMSGEEMTVEVFENIFKGLA